MTRYDKLRIKILSGRADRNLRFEALCGLLDRLDFDARVRGSHHIYYRDDIVEIINLQPRSDGNAKPYQVQQVRKILVKYGLGEPPDDE